MSNRENETRENNQVRSKQGTSSRNFLVGAVVGGVVGAAAALLLAPKAGKELLSDLNYQVNNLLEKTNQLSDDVAEKSSEIAAVTKEKTASISKTVVQQSKELINKAKNFSQNDVPLQEGNETAYISLNNAGKKANEEVDIRKKLEEAQKAFDEEENKIKQ